MGRLLAQLRQDFPQTPLCLTLDALHASGSFFQMAQDFGVSYVVVFKPGSIPTLWREFQTLQGLCPDNDLQVQRDGWSHRYRWVPEMNYTDSAGRLWKVHGIQYWGEGPQGERSEWAWLVSADLLVSKARVEKIAWGAGRPRWWEENQGFNVQKNSELNLEHAYTEGAHFGVYYVLLQIAHLLLQLWEKGSLLRHLAKESGKESAVALFGSLKNLAANLLESLRNWVWPEEAFDPPGKIQIRLDSS